MQDGVRRMGLRLVLAAVAALVLTVPARAELLGHGGLVKGVAVSPDGRVLSGGFDYALILWDVTGGKPGAVLHGHDAAVNAVAFLADGRALSAGDDGRLVLWDLGAARPERVLEAHRGRVAGLAVRADGRLAATAGWDQSVRLWDLGTGEGAALAGMTGNANAVAFSPDGSRLAAGGQDGAIRVWRLDDRTLERTIEAGGLAVNWLGFGTATGDLLAATADGGLRRWRFPGGEPVRAAALSPAPLLAGAVAPAGGRVALGGVDGAVSVLSEETGERLHRIQAHRGGTWALAFSADGASLYSAGTDGAVRVWDAETGKQIGPPARAGGTAVAMTPSLGAPPTDPGEAAFRRCVACHTVTPDGGNRAGPSLHGLFGRRIATAEGYPYSPALRRLDIVWTAESVDDLFEFGPEVVTPGSKMPMQVIADPEERRRLVRWLEESTRPR